MSLDVPSKKIKQTLFISSSGKKFDENATILLSDCYILQYYILLYLTPKRLFFKVNAAGNYMSSIFVEGTTSYLRFTNFIDFEIKFSNPSNIYLLKMNNRNSRKCYEICSKLTIQTPFWCPYC